MIKNKGKREALTDFLFVAPQLILYIAFTIVPVLIAVPMMFTNQVSFATNEVSFVGLDNFKTLFSSSYMSRILPALEKTVIFTLLNYLMVFIFGLSLALIMYDFHSKLKRFFFTVIYMPYMISGLGVGIMITCLFSRDTGSINLLLLKLGLINQAIDLKDSLMASLFVPIIIGWRYAGFNMALFLVGLLSIPTDTIEAAKIDGARYFQRLWFIYLPQMVPIIAVATVFCLIGSFGVFDELVGMGALYGNETMKLFSIVLYEEGFSGKISGSLSMASTMSMVVFVPLVIIAFLLNRLQKKFEY